MPRAFCMAASSALRPVMMSRVTCGGRQTRDCIDISAGKLGGAREVAPTGEEAPHTYKESRMPRLKYGLPSPHLFGVELVTCGLKLGAGTLPNDGSPARPGIHSKGTASESRPACAGWANHPKAHPAHCLPGSPSLVPPHKEDRGAQDLSVPGRRSCAGEGQQKQKVVTEAVLRGQQPRTTEAPSTVTARKRCDSDDAQGQGLAPSGSHSAGQRHLRRRRPAGCLPLNGRRAPRERGLRGVVRRKR